jgi:flavodoxin
MKKILIIYYTQSGQLKQIVNSITDPLQNDCQLYFEELKPVPAFPFPWTGMSFFQAFPESVREIPCKLEPFQNDLTADYDLVILAYTVWYLSPSIPVTSFLQSEAAKKLLKGKPVITILGVRNMWIMAQERVKAMISEAGGRLVGNIVMADPAGNLTSVITIVRWMTSGKKDPFRWMGMNFPAAGVPEGETRRGGEYGEIIMYYLLSNKFEELQLKLVEKGAVKVDPVLYNIEKRGKMMFGIWSKMILEKGAYNDPSREGRLKGFKYYLFTVIYLVSPFVSGLFRLIFFLNRRAARNVISKYSGI